MVEIITPIIAFIGLWGSLWYKLGKIEGEIKGHNTILQKLEKQIEHIITKTEE
mgnify:CR=1 FL=1